MGSGRWRELAATTEAGGTLIDHGTLVSPEPDRLCRAELRIEGPAGVWTGRFASPIFDTPAGLLWDTTGLLVIKYGFVVYALAGRTGELRWTWTSRTPVVGVVGSSRIEHVIAQTEVETVALGADGGPRWRVSHADVVTDVALVAGRLVLQTWGGAVLAMDPATGRPDDA